MPEYLAPGVYVEETSFRSKSIEGVATSTTAFVGPTRRGPVGVPELVTSLGDFERVFGGLEDLEWDTNYMAHAARVYFNEGGSRLYVARVYARARSDDDGHARSAPVVNGATAAERVTFHARFPGAAGNALVTLRRLFAPATRRTLETAPEGTLVRVYATAPGTGEPRPPQPARIEGTAVAPFRLTPNSVLRLEVSGGAPVNISFARCEIGGTALSDPVDLTDTSFVVTVDGIAHTLDLTGAPTAPAALATHLSGLLAPFGVAARLTTAEEAPANRLVLRNQSRPGIVTLGVEAHAGLGFAAATASGLGDFDEVTAGVLDSLLVAASANVRAGLSPRNTLLLATTATGVAATLAVRDPAPGVAAHGALGLALSPTGAGAQLSSGEDGRASTLYVKVGTGFQDRNGAALSLAGVAATAAPQGGAEIATLIITVQDADGTPAVSYEGIGLDSAHPRALGRVLAQTPGRRSEALQNLVWVEVGAGVSAFELNDGLFTVSDTVLVGLDGGDDGAAPPAGAETQEGTYAAALAELLRIEDISIVAAPGHSSAAQQANFEAIQGMLIAHAEARNAFRIAVLDTPPGQAIAEARRVRSRMDSKYAALYYPWVLIANPLARPDDERQPREIALPPSGFICGIYGRNDVQRGVFKAPANEVVRAAIRFEVEVNFAEQEVLNPLGVNCLRFFVGRGYRVWGARTASSDSEFRYVSDRRYFNYLEASVFRGSHWAVFEPNGPRLWANVREMVSNFLYAEWRGGALLGATPEEAYFVRCDRSTMTQQDLDSGRLVCEIGVALVKPAEFVIFRIGQKTADART